jgi:hypothetical protein
VIFLDPHFRFRIETGARHLHLLGERAIGEFLAEGISEGDDLSRLINRLRQYERCSPELLRAIGADRFPPRLRLVPSE